MRPTSIATLLVAAVATCVLAQDGEPTWVNAQVEQVGSVMAIAGRVLIKWADEPSAEAISGYGLSEAMVLTEVLKVYAITDGSSVQNKIAMLQTLPSVDYAEPDGVVSLDDPQPVGLSLPADRAV